MNIKVEKKYLFFEKEFKSLKEASSFFGVSCAHVSAVFNGKKLPGNKMLAKVGYKKVVTTEYVKIEPN